MSKKLLRLTGDVVRIPHNLSWRNVLGICFWWRSYNGSTTDSATDNEDELEDEEYEDTAFEELDEDEEDEVEEASFAVEELDEDDEDEAEETSFGVEEPDEDVEDDEDEVEETSFAVEERDEDDEDDEELDEDEVEETLVAVEKLDEKMHKWVQEKDGLKDRLLFNFKGWCLLVYAKDVPGYNRNCVYYHDVNADPECDLDHPCANFKVYNVKYNKFKSLCDPCDDKSPFWPPPDWLEMRGSRSAKRKAYSP